MQITEGAILCRAGAQPGPGATLTGPGPHYCRAASRLPYLRRDELDDAGQEVWDSIVGSRGQTLVNDQGAIASVIRHWAPSRITGLDVTLSGRPADQR